MTRTMHRLRCTLLALAFTAKAANAGESPDAGAASAPVPILDAVGSAYEAAKHLPADQRPAALDQVELSLAKVLRDNPDANERLAARFLTARLLFDRGEFARAADAFRDAARSAGSGSGLQDDGEFAAIEAMEASGDDVRAAKEWKEWEKRNAKSPLVPHARLAQAWNALRRGEAPAALLILDGLARTDPWMASQPSYTLGRAAALYASGKPADALSALGAKPEGVRAAYLKGLCLEAQGSLLKAAAAYQEAAERETSSPLRDQALYAKANTFLKAKDYKSASAEFARVAGRIENAELRAECELRSAAAIYLAGQSDSALVLLQAIAASRQGQDVAARAQFLVGQCLVRRGQHAEAIVEFNRLLKDYFQHAVAASAQYQVGRCLDAMGRRADATGTYQSVVSGYPLEPEAPAAAYLAGVGLLELGKPLAAVPYFQLVIDRYAGKSDKDGSVVFARPEHQELVEAALCLLEYSYHQAGNLGQLAGAPHVLLNRMAPSRSAWRAWALLFDADASAAMARYPEAQATLDRLGSEFPDHPINAQATKLLAWTYARQGMDSLAVATEERLLARWGATAPPEVISAAFLDIAHERFNQKRYREAAAAYEDFLRRFPDSAHHAEARYQAGLSYLRIDRAGDAVDRFESIVREAPASPLAERAWARAGDVYFQAAKYADARRCYEGLLANFAGSSAAGIASLRLAQCAYNEGDDAAALEGFAQTIARFPDTPSAREAARGQERALYRLSQAPQGTDKLAKLIEQYPSSAFAADAQFQIARRAYQEKRWADAADGFRRVVSQFPGYQGADQAQFLLADALAEAGQADDARAAFEQFLAFFPGSDLMPTVRFRLGLTQFANKDYMAAATSFTATLEDSAAPDVRAAARYNLALCHRMMNRADEARGELETYRREFPGDSRAADVAFQLADLDEAAGHVKEAAAGFEEALAAQPRKELRTEAGFRLGRLRERLGDADAALTAYKGAVDAGARDDAYRLSAVARCAALYETRREYTRAVAAYRDIIRNAGDQELVAVATDRVSQLEKKTGKR